MSAIQNSLFDPHAAPVFMPWFGSKGAMAPLHWKYNRFILRQHSGGARAQLLTQALAWPARAVSRVFRATRKHGEFVRARTGKSLSRQFIEHTALVLGRGLPPNSYHKFQLYDDERRAVAGEYLHRYEMRPFLARLLNRDGDRSLVSNKLRFYKRCSANDLATPEIVAKFPSAKEPVTLPPKDLVSKPRRGKGGRGVTRWRFKKGLYEASDGLSFDAAGLVAYLGARAAEDGPLLLQRLVANDRAIKDLGNGVLTTLRIMTCRNHAGVPEPVCGVFRMPVKSVSVDTFSSGGIASAVDLETGRLSAAISVKAKSPRYAHHPRRPDALIEGRELPHLEAAKQLVCRAHEAFGPFVVIGWDIGLTKRGPVLIEGNANIDVDLIQRPHGRPIGTMLLGRYLLHHLQEIPREELATFYRESGRAQ